MSEDTLSINRRGWDYSAPRFFGGTALPSYGPLGPSEDALGFLPPTTGTRILELGCGSGHSLLYLARRGAEELWGLDLSPVQIGFAKDVLASLGPRAHLVESPMELDPGLPRGYFDLVLSVYGLGWTTDLDATFRNIARYLRPGGTLVFSGEHPAYSCLEFRPDGYAVVRPYTEVGPERHESWSGTPIVIQRRPLSAFLNSMVAAGLRFEALVESDVDPAFVEPRHEDPARWYSVARATAMPATFVIRATKPSQPASGFPVRDEADARNGDGVDTRGARHPDRALA